ncbi:MAG: glutamine amidotransferase-related protein [Nitrososphaeraceae archaeon]
MIVLVVDNISPYTTDILSCLKKLKTNYTYIKFHELNDYKVSSFEKVILSGRSKPSRDINIANSKIIRDCNLSGTHMLGICYGAEIMALTLGGTICRMENPVREMSRVLLSKSTQAGSWFQKKKSIYVYESHAYCVARIPEGFDSIGRSKYCKNEIFIDFKNKLVGVQFHPEKSEDDGLAIFTSFLYM